MTVYIATVVYNGVIVFIEAAFDIDTLKNTVVEKYLIEHWNVAKGYDRYGGTHLFNTTGESEKMPIPKDPQEAIHTYFTWNEQKEEFGVWLTSVEGEKSNATSKNS